MKTCPYCAEWIEGSAIKCPECHEFLDRTIPPPIPENKTSVLPWYFRTPVVVTALLCVGPLALPMVWWHHKLKLWHKLLISAAVIGITWISIEVTLSMLEFLNRLLEMLQGM